MKWADPILRLGHADDTLGQHLGLSRQTSQYHEEIFGSQVVSRTWDDALTGDGGDLYVGLDRFGRVAQTRWFLPGIGTDQGVRLQYGYDENGNVLYEQDVDHPQWSELYHADGAAGGYDAFNRLTGFQRGVLSDGNSDGIPDSVASATRTQDWGLDALGNWTSVTTDSTTENRTHNAQNELTSLGGTNLAYDNSGSLTTDQHGYTLVYDAWNHLVAVVDGETPLVSYEYDPCGKVTVLAPDGNGGWEEATGNQSAVDWDVLHQGGRLDGVTGRYHFRNRDLDPELGRWTQADPAGYVDGMNYYEYERGDPVVSLDPSGLAVDFEENENDGVVINAGSAAGTRILSGRIYVRIEICAASSASQPATSPATQPATRPGATYRVTAIYDELKGETQYASIEAVLKMGGVENPATANLRQKSMALKLLNDALDYEEKVQQAGIKAAWEANLAKFTKAVTALAPAPRDVLEREVGKQFDAIGNAVAAEWQKMEQNDFEKRKGKPGAPRLRPGLGADLWKKVKLHVDLGKPSWADPTTQPATSPAR